MQNTRPRIAPLRIGILGAANIARQFSRDVAPSPAVRIVAVASRNADTSWPVAGVPGFRPQPSPTVARIAGAV